MPTKNKLYGLVVCGGNSTRMGVDKSMLVYYKKPQRYYLYEMLKNLCDRVFISCNASQANGVSKDYETLVDLPCYENVGPMAALLTAFMQYPQGDLLVTGCDYPFISGKDVKEFLTSVKEKKIAAFYNNEQKLYEPLLAWYSADTANLLMQLFEDKQYSLQYFLKINNAGKYFPADKKIIRSIDTPVAFESAKAVLKNKKYIE
jgi:molybdopterin-guanine dinucleotide biosynthesis protein A